MKPIGWQKYLNVYCKTEFTAQGRDYKKGDLFKWAEMNVPEEKVHQLYRSGFLYHNPEFDVQQKSGDRLNELNRNKLDRLVSLINDKVKKKTTNQTDFNRKRIKYSKLDDKQRTHIRIWLNRFEEFTDDFYEARDFILNEKVEEV